MSILHLSGKSTAIPVTVRCRETIASWRRHNQCYWRGYMVLCHCRVLVKPQPDGLELPEWFQNISRTHTPRHLRSSLLFLILLQNFPMSTNSVSARDGQHPEPVSHNSHLQASRDENMPSEYPWHSHSWRRIPYFTLLCMLLGVSGMAASLVITIKANQSKVDTWSVAPTVLLSVCAAISTMMVRAAFGSAADIFWWSSVCSKRGVDMEELHAIWDIAYNPRSLATPSSIKASLQPLLRSTASLVLLMAAVGPLLQRAITIDLDTESPAWVGPISIRREPMWNLTTHGGLNGGFDWNAQPYEGTFAQVAEELQQRQPIVLPESGDLCPSNSTCTTSVIVAGFRRTCNESSMPPASISSLKPARRISIANADDLYCPSTGSHADSVGEGSLYCTALETRFQLEFLQIYPPNVDQVDTSDPQYDNPEDMGLDRYLPPTVLGYRSYIRADMDTDAISVRSCNFATAFVSLPIQITNRNVVTLLSSRIDRRDGSLDHSSLQGGRHTIELTQAHSCGRRIVLFSMVSDNL